MKDGFLTWSDLELVARIKSGDRAAFAAVYDRYGEILYRFLLGKTENREDARDIMHDVFERVWARREKLADDVALFPYLFRSVQNRSLDLIRHQITRQKYIDSFQNFLANKDELAISIEIKDLLSVIQTELRQLPPNTAKIMEMRIIEGFNNKEIAALLELSEDSVKSHVKRGTRLLKTKNTRWILTFLVT